MFAGDAAAGGFFGFSLAVSGSKLLIGSPNYNSNNGVAYILDTAIDLSIVKTGSTNIGIIQT